MASAMASASTRAGARPAFFGGAVTGPALAPRRATSACPLSVVAAWGNLPKLNGGRKWERYELSPSGQPVRIKMHIRKGDTVQARPR